MNSVELQNRTMKRNVLGTFIVFTLTHLSATLGLVVDGIIIGNFMGSTSLAVFSGAICFSVFIEMISGTVTSGIQISCGQAAGQGKIQDANSFLSSAAAMTAFASLIIISIIWFFPGITLTVCGFNDADETIRAMLNEYMRAYSFGIPAIIGSGYFLAVLQIVSNRKAGFISIAAMIIVNLIGDLAVVLFGEGDMYGIGLATAISYWIGFAIILYYFKKGQNLFSISIKMIRISSILEVLRCGLAYALYRVTAVIRNPIINYNVLRIGGISAMVMCATYNTVSTMLYSVSNGIKDTSMTLMGVIYGKDDKNELKNMFGFLLKKAALFGGITSLSCVIFAPFIVEIYIDISDVAYNISVTGLRLAVLEVVIGAVLGVFVGYYSALKKLWLGRLLHFADAFFPMLFFWILLPMGIYAAPLCFTVGRFAVILLIILIVIFSKKTIKLKMEDLLLIPPDFGCSEENRLDFELTGASKKPDLEKEIEEFCMDHQVSSAESVCAALYTGLLVDNVSAHFMNAQDNEYYMHVTIYVKNNSPVIHIEDNFPQYNPEEWFSNENSRSSVDESELALMEKIFKSAEYVHVLKLNHLTIRSVNGYKR